MFTPVAATLIADASDLLEQCSSSPLSDGNRQYCARLALLLRMLVRDRHSVIPDDVSQAAEARWTDNPGIKLERPMEMRTDADGIWVAAWLRAAEPVNRQHSAAAIDAALAAVPVLAREVFLLHRRDGIDFEGIAERLAITLDEVAQQFVVAVLEISAELRRSVAAARSRTHKA